MAGWRIQYGRVDLHMDRVDGEAGGLNAQRIVPQAATVAKEHAYAVLQDEEQQLGPDFQNDPQDRR